MLRGGVSVTAGLADIKTPDWSAVPAARTKDMQASGAQCPVGRLPGLRGKGTAHEHQRACPLIVLSCSTVRKN